MDNLIDSRVEPVCDVDAEKAVLSLCMRRNSAVMDVVKNKVSAEDFTDSRNSTIFGVILDMFFDEVTIDRITVISELERCGLLEKAGGQRYVYHVGDTVASQSAINSYIDAMRLKGEKQKLLKLAEKIREETIGGKHTTSEIINYVISELSQLRGFNDEKDLVVLNDVLKMTISGVFTEIMDAKNGGKIKLGFPKLDMMTGGLGNGTVNILAARPGMGKTALAVNMAVNVAANQHPVVIFSLEMTLEEIGRRIMSSAMTRPISEIISSNKLTESDKQQMDNALKKLRDYPIYLDDSVDINPLTMKTKIKQLTSAGIQPKLIFVDYLQLIEVKGMGNKSRNDEVAKISRSLKLLAKELKIPIIALSQLSRDTAKRNDHTPQISDLRDSGAIEQDADTIMFVDRPDYYKTNDSAADVDPKADSQNSGNSGESAKVLPACIYLAKNRHGATGKDPVSWIPDKTLFYEYTGKDPQDSYGGDSVTYSYEAPAEDNDEPAMDPPLSEEESVQQDSLFTDVHDEYPEGLRDL